MLDKKYLKKLYNINQDIKKVFEVYYVFNNGVILSSGKDVQKGIVINTDLFKDLLDNSDNVIVINSLLLFEIFKKFKISQIEGIEIRDSKIGAIADGEFQIFAIYKPINDKILSLYSLNSPYIENNYGEKITLDAEQIESIMSNKSINVHICDKRIMLCKSAIPAIKKKSNVVVQVDDNMMNNIFYAKLNINNDNGCIISKTIRCLNI